MSTLQEQKELQRKSGDAQRVIDEQERWRDRRRKEIIKESSALSERNKLTYGMFHEITPLCVGEPFKDPSAVTRQLAKNKPNIKNGLSRSIDGCFSAILPSGACQEERLTAKKSKTSFVPFRAGFREELKSQQVYALINSDKNMSKEKVKEILQRTRMEGIKADKERIQRIRNKVVSSQPNITTRPIKKGTYGYPGLLLGEDFQSSNVPLPNSKYQNERAKNKNDNKIDTSRPVFCGTSSKTSRTFSKDQQVYIHKPICYQPQDKKRPSTASARLGNQSDESRPPFKPGGKTEKPIYMGYPKYLPHNRVSSARGMRKDIKDDPNHRAWRPNSASQSRPVRSIFLHPASLRHECF